MKKVIKTLVAALAAACVWGAAFAQQTTTTSNTKTSTRGLFTNDIDDFMNVNYWSNVKPENVFGYAGYNNGIVLGFSKQFTPFYLGANFNGQIPGTYSETKKEYNPDSTTKSNGTIYDTTNATWYTGDYTIGVLFGINNFGIRYDFSFGTLEGDALTNDSNGKNGNSTYDMGNYLTAGILLEGDKTIAPYFRLGFDVYKNTAYTTTATSYMKTDYSSYNLAASGGVEITSDGKGKVVTEHTVNLGLGTNWRFFPKVQWCSNKTIWKS